MIRFRSKQNNEAVCGEGSKFVFSAFTGIFETMVELFTDYTKAQMVPLQDEALSGPRVMPSMEAHDGFLFGGK